MRHPIACAVGIAVVAASMAMAQETTGRLIGRVMSEDGNTLSGVSVTIASPALIGGLRTEATEADGSFSFIGIAPGLYTVKAELAGLVSQERTGVKVPLGGAAALNIIMPDSRFEGEIEVSAETPVVDPTQVNTEQVFDAEYLEKAAVGADSRLYMNVLRHAPGVEGGWAALSVFGSTVAENAYYADGFDTTDPANGRTASRINLDMIQEIQLQTGGFEAEFGRASGGVVNVLTRSGGNRFSGALDIRYRDDSFQENGDHFDTSELDTSYSTVGAVLGGPILRDTLWFFLAAERIDDKDTPSGSLTTRELDARAYLGKLTWQIAPSWRLMGKYSSEPATIDNANASRWVALEANSHEDYSKEILNGELFGVLSDSLLWEATFGVYRRPVDGFPQSGDLQTISHYNWDTGMLTENYFNQQSSQRNRDDFRTGLTWFVDNLAGSHEFKGGLEYSRTEFTRANCSTGTLNGERCVPGGVGFQFYDVWVDGPVPYVMEEFSTAGTLSHDGRLYTGYVQDAWRMAPKLTLKLGLRYDTVAYDTDTGEEVAVLDKLQPRVGVAWDVLGDTTNVVRASWGRYMDRNALTLPSFARSIEEPYFRWYSCTTVLELASAAECAAVADRPGWAYRTDSEGWDPNGWVLPPWEHYFEEPNQVVPDLRAAYADELIVAYEREVGRRSSVEVTFVDKKTRDIFEDTCNVNWPTPSPEEACDHFVMANLPEATRDYRAGIVRYESRGFDWLTLLASYTYSRSRGSVQSSQNQGTDFDFYPWHYDNRYGYLWDHQAHRVKLNGFFYLRGDWTFSFDGYWASPWTWTPYETFRDNPEMPDYTGSHFVEPRGSRDGDNYHRLDLQLAKGFTLGGVRLVLIGAALNAFSSENVVWVCDRVSGCGGDEFEMGEPTDWQTPRRWELGFRIEF
jgi:hypothetical protein